MQLELKIVLLLTQKSNVLAIGVRRILLWRRFTAGGSGIFDKGTEPGGRRTSPVGTRDKAPVGGLSKRSPPEAGAKCEINVHSSFNVSLYK